MAGPSKDKVCCLFISSGVAPLVQVILSLFLFVLELLGLVLTSDHGACIFVAVVCHIKHSSSVKYVQEKDQFTAQFGFVGIAKHPYDLSSP